MTTHPPVPEPQSTSRSGPAARKPAQKTTTTPRPRRRPAPALPDPTDTTPAAREAAVALEPSGPAGAPAGVPAAVWPPAGVRLSEDDRAARIHRVKLRVVPDEKYPEVMAFVRAAVYDLDVSDKALVRNLTILARHTLLHHATDDRRLSLVRSEIFSLDTVTATGTLGLPGYAERSQQTYMSTLTKAARALAPEAGWAPEWKGTKSASVEPYSPAEVKGLLALAHVQPLTRGSYRRRITLAVLALGLGAGLVGEEMRLVRGTDVHVARGAVMVRVRAEGKERDVPVLGAYEHLLLELSQAAGERPLLGRSKSRNVASTIAAEVVGGSTLPRINAHRMRRTWLAEVTPVAPISAILRATGRQNLGDLGGIADASRLTDEQYQRVLRLSSEEVPLQGQLTLFPSYDLSEKRPVRKLLRSVSR